jgi:putative membrane protein
VSASDRPFWGRTPLAWVGFALAVLAIPVFGLVREQHADFVAFLPTLNASLNALAGALAFAAWRAIRGGHVATHRALMISATLTSVLFLIFYVVRFSLTGTHRYPAQDWTRGVYLVVLGSHTLLAAAVPFLVGRSLWLAWKGRFDAHRRIARVTFPIWCYVSVTGVLVYLMLYHLAPARL